MRILMVLELKQVAGTVQQADLGMGDLGTAEPGLAEPGYTQMQRESKELARELLIQRGKAVQPSFPSQAQAERSRASFFSSSFSWAAAEA